jgi:hypothetical protein
MFLETPSSIIVLEEYVMKWNGIARPRYGTAKTRTWKPLVFPSFNLPTYSVFFA